MKVRPANQRKCALMLAPLAGLRQCGPERFAGRVVLAEALRYRYSVFPPSFQVEAWMAITLRHLDTTIQRSKSARLSFGTYIHNLTAITPALSCRITLR